MPRLDGFDVLHVGDFTFDRKRLLASVRGGKVEEDPSSPRHVRTIRGSGYFFVG